jgi:hypothetical protein
MFEQGKLVTSWVGLRPPSQGRYEVLPKIRTTQ